MATIRLDPLIVKKFSGLNLDLSEEKMPPGAFVALTNMKVDIDGDLKRVNGCTLKKDVSGVSDAIKIGLFSTRGEKYVLVYHADKKVRVYTWPDFTEISYSTNYDDIDSITLEEEPWFATHNGEIYFGSLADGMWRWKGALAHQPLMRGSAPNDIVVQLGDEEGIKEKDYLEWEFAYDYEKNGGRSPLSRKARVKLYNNKLKVKVIIDTPPLGSRGRRIYASPDNGTTWYYVKEVTDNDKIFTILDSELVDNITSNREYSESAMVNTMSPGARFGVSFLGRLYVGYTKNSPSEILYSEIGKPYINYTNAFDLNEPLTNLIAYGNIVASGLNKISICSDEPKRMNPITVGMGAFEGSMAVVNNKLYFVNEYGVLEYSSKGLKRMGTDEYLSADELSHREGLVSANFTDLKKPKRTILITDQGDYERGEYNEGVSSDVFPGALTLQQNVVTGIAGILEEHTANSSDFGKLENGSYITSFQIQGDSTEEVTVEAISLLVKKVDSGGNPDEVYGGLIGELRKDDPENPGYPDMSTDGLISEFGGETRSGVVDFEKYNLTEKKTVFRGTDYWIVLPKQGHSTCTWEIYGNDWDQFPMYMRGRAYWSDGGGTTWVKHDHIQDFCFKIHGKSSNILISSDTGYHGTLESKVYTRAIPFSVEVEEVELDFLEIIGDKVGSPGGITTAAIYSDNNGEPGDKIWDIPTFTELNDPEWEAEGFPGDIFTFQSEFVSGETLSKGNYWIILPEEGTGTNDYYKWIQAAGEGDSLRSSDGGSSWEEETSDYGIWFKFWATSSYESFASSGNWVSPKFSIGENDDFDKVYWSRMVPSGATAKLYIDEDESGSWTEITSSTPYSITGDTTIIQFKVELSLGTANFTPIVDSILITFTKENDEGDILRAGNVNGKLFISRIDDNNDGSEEFTYVLSKMNTIHTLSEPFYDFLSIAEKTTLGIGKNTNGDLNIFELDKGSSWYAGGSYSKDIATEIETGEMLYDSMLKLYRRAFLHLKTSSSASLKIDFSVGGGERVSSDTIMAISSHYITITNDITKPGGFSLPDKMQGIWFKIKIASEGDDWGLHGFEVYPFGKTGRIIPVPISTVVARHISSTDCEEAYCETVYGNYLFVGTAARVADNYPYLEKYFINADGTLTLVKSTKLTNYPNTSVYQIIVTANYVYVGMNTGIGIYTHNFALVGKTISTYNLGGLVILNDEQHAWGCNAYSNEKKLYHYDISDKSNPTQELASTDCKFQQLCYLNGNICTIDESDRDLRVYDANDPADVPYNLLGKVALSEENSMYSLLANKEAKTLCYGGRNYGGIIGLSDPTNPSVLAESDSEVRCFLAKKGRFLFGLDPFDNKVIVSDTVDYCSLESESDIDYTLGSEKPNANLEIDINRNLLFYGSRDYDKIEVFKIFGI